MMCDTSGLALGDVLGQRKNNLFHPIYYASKTLNCAHKNSTVMNQELFIVLYGFENFRAYLLGTKVVMHTDYVALRYVMAKKEAKPRLFSGGCFFFKSLTLM
ncbi:hypothetical protein MTR67_043418 [Solanum verrucosum]|uniref:Reverse transcriptase RNase H-like domain-containing protein n=1 Tax=Solanum verrucosum TaxID=315347 RepID=A0AAF0UNP7_SOLVR|nr:hypothetical protein MTR67_043418 [Solanum verrucosum]